MVRLQDSYLLLKPVETLEYYGRAFFVVPPWSHPKIVPMTGLEPPPDDTFRPDSMCSGTDVFPRRSR